jgi:hypothetical protein
MQMLHINPSLPFFLSFFPFLVKFFENYETKERNINGRIIFLSEKCESAQKIGLSRRKRKKEERAFGYPESYFICK